MNFCYYNEQSNDLVYSKLKIVTSVYAAFAIQGKVIIKE